MGRMKPSKPMRKIHDHQPSSAASTCSSYPPSEAGRGCDPPGMLLDVPRAPLRITMDSPDFERLLTSAEKLNDHNYRGLVYRAYPNEPSCACPAPIVPGIRRWNKPQQQPQQTPPLRSACRSGCTSRCCSSVRQRRIKDSGVRDDPVAERRGQSLPSGYCAPSAKGDNEARGRTAGCALPPSTPSSAPVARMRGGGGVEIAGLLTGDADFTWYNSRFTLPPSRLEGGGGGEMYRTSGCAKAPQVKIKDYSNQPKDDFLQWNSINPGYLAGNKCKLRHVEEADKSACSCPDKDPLEAALKKRGHAMCTKKPCLGTDCLIKAFKDAQNFVDSIGREPGLAGLGIIESPFFGKPPDSREAKKAESRTMTTGKPPEPSTTLCNAQILENMKKLSFNAAQGVYPLTAKKQDGAAAAPEPAVFVTPKSKKKEEKIEKPKEMEVSIMPIQQAENTPCGQPKCQSRPKKVVTDCGNGDSADKASASREKFPGGQRNDRKQSSKTRSQSSPADKALNSKSSTRLPRKEGKFAYDFGNSYPASVYGHKNCSLPRNRVPAHMGWMWNKYDDIAKIEPRKGWRPGAISTALREILKEAKDGFFNHQKRPRSAPTRGKKGKPGKNASFTAIKKGCGDEEEEEVEYPPTLHVHRKNGIYYITMYPVRQETADEPRVDEPINPLQFKIVKSKGSIASSSTASDMEIEFSPPAAVNRLRKKPNVVHIETQVKQQEILDAVRKLSVTKNRDSKEKKGKGKKK